MDVASQVPKIFFLLLASGDCRTSCESRAAIAENLRYPSSCAAHKTYITDTSLSSIHLKTTERAMITRPNKYPKMRMSSNITNNNGHAANIIEYE